MPIFPADDLHLELAAQRLRDGELVAFPTETVYGLGANALDENAVAKIYAAKGRPSFNPLIVHVADQTAAQGLVSGWNERAEALAKAFWPGPLTLVLLKKDFIPDIVSAGLNTVAIRVPAQPIARELLKKAGIPLAAPSANTSGEVSPTLASHVIESLGERCWVLDGGPCEVGIESTVVDVSSDHVSILRPGIISASQIEALVGPLTPHNRQDGEQSQNGPLPSPGMLLRHYAPRAKVHIFPNLTDAHFHAVLLGSERKIGVIAFAPTRLEGAAETILAQEPASYAKQLYSLLRDLDARGVDLILIEEVPQTAEWLAVRDRLNRASEASASPALESKS
ncbi:threonylcarbamoyl-AMP synthase [bacterium]|nr:MAG: threonylcarbamoyl-AMP synthase [bacterium]